MNDCPVLVLPGNCLEAWLADQRIGQVESGWAQELGARLDAVATNQDAKVEAGPILRYLARVR